MCGGNHVHQLPGVEGRMTGSNMRGGGVAVAVGMALHNHVPTPCGGGGFSVSGTPVAGRVVT